MYDIKSIETGEKDLEIYCVNNSISTSSSEADLGQNNSSMSLRRRRVFQRQACLLSVMAAFSLGLALGVFVPMVGMSAASDFFVDRVNQTTEVEKSHPVTEEFSVSFVKEKKLPAEEVFRNAFHLEQDKNADDLMIVKRLEPSDGSIKEFKVQRTPDGYFRKGPEVRISKPSITEQVLAGNPNSDPKGDRISVEFVPITPASPRQQQPRGVIDSDIYWGELVERYLPHGFDGQDAEDWTRYVQTSAVSRLETGCGRMQNRMVVFKDGKRACARYRQNTDQIQGELFSFYLGQLLNLTNLAPSAASVIDFDAETWSNAAQDISTAQWKSMRPVVLTKWLPDLEPAGIPTQFQPLERHLNKYDVWNITSMQPKVDEALPHHKGLLGRLGANANRVEATSQNTSQNALNSTALNRLVELAQWSDLIVFDYLIANLDRVVNNLYNYQWNADIMAAPAHNLARQTDSQLLVFLDNESGLLHGYRLLKKYEAYHGLLLDNLCVFRRPTIEALRRLRDDDGGGGRGGTGVEFQLQQLFERSTTSQLRDVLPSLPDKSIKILIDRIDRVLGQVQKCRDLFADR